MPDRSRVPKTLEKFHPFITVAVPYLFKIDAQSNLPQWNLLGLTSAEANKARKYLNKWDNGSASPKGIYQLHSSGTTKTKVTRGKVVQLMKDFSKFFSPLLNRMSTSANLSMDGRTVLHIPLPKTNHTVHTVKIEADMELAMLSSGCNVRFICRVVNSERRPHKPERADSVKIAYHIGEPVPSHADDKTVKEIFTSAVFILPCGMQNQGKRLYAYARWYNTKYPRLAGDWCEMQQIMIS